MPFRIGEAGLVHAHAAFPISSLSPARKADARGAGGSSSPFESRRAAPRSGIGMRMRVRSPSIPSHAQRKKKYAQPNVSRFLPWARLSRGPVLPLRCGTYVLFRGR